jgi:hypothetical protein
MPNEDLMNALSPAEARLASAALPFVVSATRFRQSLREGLMRSFLLGSDGSIKAARGLQKAANADEEFLNRAIAVELGLQVPKGQRVLTQIHFGDTQTDLTQPFFTLRREAIENAKIIWQSEATLS